MFRGAETTVTAVPRPLETPNTMRPKVDIKINYTGTRTLRGRIGFALMRAGARLASEPILFKRDKS